jgi:hypothetical protein
MKLQDLLLSRTTPPTATDVAFVISECLEEAEKPDIARLLQMLPTEEQGKLPAALQGYIDVTHALAAKLEEAKSLAEHLIASGGKSADIVPFPGSRPDEPDDGPGPSAA